ncbi:hypothetical protein ACFX12_012286 [Malus domestica]
MELRSRKRTAGPSSDENEQHEEKEDAYSPSDEDTYVPPSSPSASDFESEEGEEYQNNVEFVFDLKLMGFAQGMVRCYESHLVINLWLCFSVLFSKVLNN